MQSQESIINMEMRTILSEIKEVEFQRELVWSRAKYLRRTSSLKARKKMVKFSLILDELYSRLDNLNVEKNTRREEGEMKP